MTYVKVDVNKPGDNKGVGGDKKAMIILFDFDDVATMPVRDSKGIVITGNLAFKSGAYMSKIYATQSTIKAGADSEGDPDAKGITQSVEFDHPGDEVAIREFRSNWMNRNIGIIIEKCSDTKKNLYGSLCAPLQMVFKAEDDKDKKKTAFTFKSVQKGPDVADYQGSLTFDTVMATVAANATSLNVASGEGRYQLTTGSGSAASITTMTNPINGGKYTLLGSGGTYPSTIEKDNDFILSSGTTWTAIEGAEITFEAFKSTSSTWIFIECSRK